MGALTHAASAPPASAELTYTSHDGEEGYPGTVTASADYRLTCDNELVMVFSATTDKATPINVRVCHRTGALVVIAA